MLRYLLAIIISITCINNIISQGIVVNEIINSPNGIVSVELYNNSLEAINIKSVSVHSAGIELIRDLKVLEIQPSYLSLIELELGNNPSEFDKVFIKIITDNGEYYTSFNGFLLKGESAGRYPDVTGDFIIYQSSFFSPGEPNPAPGLLIKKTSHTKFSPRDSSPNAALFYNKYYWIFGGWDYDPLSETYESSTNVWKSADGLDWELVNEHPPFSHYSSYFVFNNKMMVYKWDSVFISQNGKTWAKHALNTGYSSQSRYTVFKGKAYVFCNNMIGISSDGINWTYSQTDIDTDPSRFLPAFVASKDRLWLYGGNGFNDVWSSTDGLHWTKLLSKAPWAKRHWFNYTFFDNKIWMIAGNQDGEEENKDFGNLQDFWYSSDGIKWYLLNTDKSFNNRHGSFLWNDGKRVLISSGFGNNTPDRLYNDIWELNPKKAVPQIVTPVVKSAPGIIQIQPGLLPESDQTLSLKTIYPNPNLGVIKISEIGYFSMRIFDIAGRQIFLKTYPDYYPLFEEDLSSIFKSIGIYIIVLSDNNTGEVFSQKLNVVK